MLRVYVSNLVLLVAMSISVTAFVAQDSQMMLSTFHKHQSELFRTTPLFAKAETEIEKLLRMARELKQSAAAAEESLQVTKLDKKAKKDSKTDSLISLLFPVEVEEVSDLVNRIRTKKPSTECLVDVVERLHEREIKFRGLSHVGEISDNDDNKKFTQITSEVDTEEVAKISAFTGRLIAATKIIDDEWFQARGTNQHRTHAEAEHWTAGDVSKILSDRSNILRREHEDQYQKKQEDYYKKALKKDDKVKP